MPPRPATVYKIVTREAWAAAVAREKFTGSADDERDGFIHLSAAHQIAGTLARHFVGHDDLLLVAVASDRLGARLQWEASRGGEDFPHLYAPLQTADALWVRELTRGDDGTFNLPPGLA